MKGQFSQTLRLLKSPTLPLRRITLRPKIRPISVQRAPVFQQVTFRRYAHNEPVDDPAWSSVIDQPPLLVRSAQKHSPGIIILRMTCLILRLARPLLTALSSPHTSHCIRSWNMADLSS